MLIVCFGGLQNTLTKKCYLANPPLNNVHMYQVVRFFLACVVLLAPVKASGSPPVINTVAGENTQIDCTFSISNYHGNVIFWRFEETPIRDVSVNNEVKYNMLQESGQGRTSTLTIFNTTLNDEGSYFCITPTNTEILEREHNLVVNG